MKLEDFLTLTDAEIGCHFSGSYGPQKRREAIELIRELARLEKVDKAKVGTAKVGTARYPIFDGA